MDRSPVPSQTTGTLAVTRFTTAHVAPHERHALWRSHGWLSAGQLYDCTADPGFTAKSKAVSLGDVTVSVGHYGAQEVERTPVLRRRTPVDHLIVLLPLDAPMNTENELVAPGSAVMLDLTDAWRHRSERGRMVTLSLPRPLALAHGIDPGAVHGTVLPPPAAALLRSHVLQIVDQAPLLPAATAPRLATTVLELLNVSLTPNTAATLASVETVETALRIQAVQLIVEALERPWLNADYLARELGVSRSRLYRLFDSEGGIQRRIRRERLLAARTALEQGDVTLGLAEIAARYHFTDLAHFSRAFRAEFEVSPTAWRAASLLP